jgi:GNAT superfamily N-acetyltransferase
MPPNDPNPSAVPLRMANAPPGFSIAAAQTPDDVAAVSILFTQYAESLPISLDYQGFGEELASLPGKYGGPDGALLLARDGAGVPMACVAMRPAPAGGCCEMKRLFVRPEARGLQLGRAMAIAILEVARGRGYELIRLDTLPSMHGAKSLYLELGFVEIAPYYAPTPAGTLFLALKLK